MVEQTQSDKYNCYKQGVALWYGKAVMRGCLPRFTNQAL